MPIKLDGIKLSNKINEKIREEILKLKIIPHLVAIQVGENPESKLYLKTKSKKAKELGIKFTLLTFDDNINTMDLVSKIEEINKSKEIDGIMVQLPLPKHIDTKIISQSIVPWKDVDAFHPLNKGLLDINKAELIPPTAQGVMELLSEYKINIKSKIVTIIGLGEIAGKPLAKLLINNGATVIMCNKNTKDVPLFTKQADIVVAAVGYKHLVKEDYIKDGSIVINIGVTKDLEGIHGDIELEKIFQKTSYFTPIIGGTGPMTVSILMKNTLLCYKLRKINN